MHKGPVVSGQVWARRKKITPSTNKEGKKNELKNSSTNRGGKEYFLGKGTRWAACCKRQKKMGEKKGRKLVSSFRRSKKKRVNIAWVSEIRVVHADLLTRKKKFEESATRNLPQKVDLRPGLSRKTRSTSTQGEKTLEVQWRRLNPKIRREEDLKVRRQRRRRGQKKKKEISADAPNL